MCEGFYEWCKYFYCLMLELAFVCSKCRFFQAFIALPKNDSIVVFVSTADRPS